MGTTGRKSTVEQHPDFLLIRQKLANDVSTVKLAEQTGLSSDALLRYKHKMTKEEIARLRYSRFRESEEELAELRETEASKCVSRNAVMMSELFAAYRLAVDTEDWRSAANLANSYFRFAKLQSELVGELVRGSQHVHLEVTESVPYRNMVSLLLAWASDKPQLQTQLAEFIDQHEADFAPAQLEGKPNGDGSFIAS